MAKQTIYANEIKPLKSVISVLSGFDNFAIENPWFPIPGAKPCDPKTFLNVIPDKKGGLFLNAPRLLHKTASGPFSWNFVIGWTQIVSNQKLKKEYRINAPVAQEELKRKQKLMVSPVKRELEPDDAALLLFSWQLSIVQDIILIAKILNISIIFFIIQERIPVASGLFDEFQPKIIFRPDKNLTVSHRPISPAIGITDQRVLQLKDREQNIESQGITDHDVNISFRLSNDVL